MEQQQVCEQTSMLQDEELQGEDKELEKDDTTEAHDITDAPHSLRKTTSQNVPEPGDASSSVGMSGSPSSEVTSSTSTPQQGCPMCKVEVPEEPPTDIKYFNFDNFSLKHPKKAKISFKEATVDYLENNYSNLQSNSFKIPPYLFYGENEGFDFVTDDEVPFMAHQIVKQKEEEEKAKLQGPNTPGKAKLKGPKTPAKAKLKGPKTPGKISENRTACRAVEKVANAFYLHGKDILKPSFVLSDFKFLNFLRNMKLPKEVRLEVYKVNGDHDVLVISQKKGVIFIQVKSADEGETCGDQLADAYRQVLKDNLAIKSMNADLNFIKSLPMKAYVAVPYLTDEQLDAITICKNHRDIILSATNLKKENFSGWLVKKGFSNEVEKPPVLNTDQYVSLVSRYVGLASIVELRTVRDALDKTAAKVSRFLLTKDQRECLDRNSKKQIILGDYGTGKSLLLMRKAEEVACNGESVYVISFSNVIDHDASVSNSKDFAISNLKLMLRSEKSIKSNMLTIQTFHEHLMHVGKCQSLKFPQDPLPTKFDVKMDTFCDIIEENFKRQGKVHYFIDELPLTVPLFGGTWERLKKLCESNKSMFLWIAISRLSIDCKTEQEFNSFEQYGILPGPPFETTKLNRCMRTTKNVFKLIQAIRKFTGDEFGMKTYHGNVIEGPAPEWFVLSSCICSNDPDPLRCRCLGSKRLCDVLRVILQKVQVEFDDICIIVNGRKHEVNSFLENNLGTACSSNNASFKLYLPDSKTPLCEKESDPAITIACSQSQKSTEHKVVIYVDPYGNPIERRPIPSAWNSEPDIILAASRSLASFFVISWPFEDEMFFIREVLPSTKKNFMYLEQFPRQERPSKVVEEEFQDFLLKEDVIKVTDMASHLS